MDREHALGSTSRNKVRTLVVVGADEREMLHRTVECAASEDCVPLEDCASCPRRIATKLDPLGRESYVLCRTPPADVVEKGLSAPVGALMGAEVVAVRPDVPAELVLNLLVERGFSGVPVVDTQFRPLGIVSSADLLEERYDEQDGGGPESEGLLTASDLMTQCPLTIREETSIAEAAAKMAYHRVHRLPVVADSGEVVGLVGTLDLLRYVAELGGFALPAVAGER